LTDCPLAASFSPFTAVITSPTCTPYSRAADVLSSCDTAE
jgi:hypothetical protein